jgi:hypothetical protein
MINTMMTVSERCMYGECMVQKKKWGVTVTDCLVGMRASGAVAWHSGDDCDHCCG